MDQDLSLQLQEKNLEIFQNKLKLDVSNNMDSLTLSLGHILDFEVSSALSKFLMIYTDVSSSVDSSKLHHILVQIGQRYLEEMKQYLKKKRADIFEEIQSLSISFSEADFSHIVCSIEGEDFSQLMKDKLVSSIQDMVATELEKLNEKYVALEQRDFVFSRGMRFLIEHFVRRLVDRTVEQVHMRNQTLINNANKNYEHYCSLPTRL